jgi:hypothetical protein
MATRRLKWEGNDFMTVMLPSSPKPEPGSIVLMSGLGALAYAIPAFPPDVRFLGVDVMEHTLPSVGEGGESTVPASEPEMGPFAPYLHAVIAAHRGQVLGMFNERSRDRAIATYARYGFLVEAAHCGLITSNVAPNAPLNLCILSRS